MNNIPPYPSTFPATSTNFFAPFLTVQANFSEISDRMIYLEGERAAMAAQLELHDSRINDLIVRVEALEGRPIGVAGFSAFWARIAGNTVSFAGRGTSLDGIDTYDVPYTSINVDMSHYIVDFPVPGFRYIHLGRVDGALAIRISGDYANPSALQHSCIIGICTVVSLNPLVLGYGECSAGIYTGYMLWPENAKYSTIANNTSWGLQLTTNIRDIPGLAWSYYTSSINRWGSGVGINICGNDLSGLYYPGEGYSTSVDGFDFRGMTNSSGAATIRNTSGSSRNIYIYPACVHLPSVYKVS